MDTVIQSLTQSSLVKKLSETSHNLKRFTHDIPDNAPYRSQSKIIIDPISGNNVSPSGTLRFSIKRAGYINRIFMRVKLKRADVPLEGGQYADPNFLNRPFGPEFFGSFFVSAELMIGGKTVETLYPESILYKACQLRGPISDSILLGLRGQQTNYGDENLGELGFGNRVNNPANIDPFVNFLIPLEFSLFQFFKDSIDTNFLPKVEVVIKKKPILFMQSQNPSASSTLVQLECMYHNLHQHFKNQLRNTQHPQETQTLLLADSYLLNVSPVIGPLVPGEFGTETFKMDNLDLFATDILITFIRTDRGQGPDEFYGEIEATPPQASAGAPSTFIQFTLKANDRILFDKFHYEMFDHHQNVSNLDIQDAVDDALMAKVIGEENKKNVGFARAGTVDFHDNDVDELTAYRNLAMYRIPLSLFSSDEFLSGGLQLNNLTNVELTIKGYPLLIPDIEGDDRRGLKPRIVIRHKKLVRVDGKNGTIS